jgi:hypothetical protein
MGTKYQYKNWAYTKDVEKDRSWFTKLKFEYHFKWDEILKSVIGSKWELYSYLFELNKSDWESSIAKMIQAINTSNDLRFATNYITSEKKNPLLNKMIALFRKTYWYEFWYISDKSWKDWQLSKEWLLLEIKKLFDTEKYPEHADILKMEFEVWWKKVNVLDYLNNLYQHELKEVEADMKVW